MKNKRFSCYIIYFYFLWRKWHKQRNRENIKLARCPGLLTNRQVFLHTIRLTFIATLTNRDKPVRLVAPTMDKAFPGPQRALRDPTSPIPSTFQRSTIIGLGWVGRSWDARAIAWQEKMHLKNKYKKKGSSHSLHARYGLCDSRWVLRSKPRPNFCLPLLLMNFSFLFSIIFFSRVLSFFYSAISSSYHFP